MKKITDLYELAEYINSSESYPSDVEEIIADNGWEICSDDRDIAIDSKTDSLLTINECGEAIVR